MCAKSFQLCPTLCDPMDCMQPVRLLSPWDSPGKNTAVGCHILLPPGNLPNPGIKPTTLMSPALAGEFFTTSTTCTSPLQQSTVQFHHNAFSQFLIEYLMFPRGFFCFLFFTKNYVLVKVLVPLSQGLLLPLSKLPSWKFFIIYPSSVQVRVSHHPCQLWMLFFKILTMVYSVSTGCGDKVKLSMHATCPE